MPRISRTAKRELTEKRRKQILDAAIKVFAAKGFDRATIADIAREAKVAEGSIYNYFKSKDDLLIALPQLIIQAPLETLSGMSGAHTVEETLVLAARTFLGMFRKNSSIFRILISVIPTANPSLRKKYLDQVILFAIGVLDARFQMLVSRGQFRADLNTSILARAFVGMFMPTILMSSLLRVETGDSFDDDEMISTCVKVFLRGAMSPDAVDPSRLRRKIPID